jgi:hypothetical protein
MSRESMETLNTLTLIGNTLNRGTAWHYRRDLQGAESNHYDGFIPVDDVNRRLWKAISTSLAPMVLALLLSLIVRLSLGQILVKRLAFSRADILAIVILLGLLITWLRF